MNKRSHTVISLICTFLFLFGCDEANDSFRVEHRAESNPNFTDDKYEFPFLVGSDEAVCLKVNSTLFNKVLNMQLGRADASIFENIWRTNKEDIAGLNYLRYEVAVLTENLYSVSFSGEWCSARCDPYLDCFTFDLNTGDLVDLKQLTDDCFELIEQHSAQEYQSEIAQSLAGVRGRQLESDDPVFFEEAIEQYKECLKKPLQLHSQKFVIQDSAIVIYPNPCFLNEKLYNEDPEPAPILINFRNLCSPLPAELKAKLGK